MSGSWIDSAIAELKADIHTHKGIVEANLMDIKTCKEKIEKLKTEIAETKVRVVKKMDRIERLQKIVEGLRKIQEERSRG